MDESGLSALPPPEAGAVLTIDLAALKANWRFLQESSEKAECAAVVKANAYGIGLEPAVKALSEAGCKTFFVALLSEAVQAREIDPEAVIYVLNGLAPDTAPAYAGLNLRPILGSMAEIREWSTFCASSRAFPYGLHIDTGMNRLGLGLEDALALKESLSTAVSKPALLMSHFVSSEKPDDPFNDRQIAAFEAARKAFPDVPASLANSSGIFLKQNPHFDLVRPGYALYGGNPVPGRPNPMQPVIRLEARIVRTRIIEDGETVGYNAGWTARGRRRLAVLSVGYADGFPRSASATDSKAATGLPVGAALVSGCLCPFAGRISMDLIVVDITAVPEKEGQRGNTVTLIGDALSLDQVAANAGTIGYEILTHLGSRYARIYRDLS